MSSQLLDHFKKENLSHAYCVVGDIHANQQLLQAHFHDVFDDYILQVFSFDRMKIDDARLLRSFGAEQGKKIMLIQIAFAQHEAQNALLKFIEEPARDTHVVVLVPGSDTLISTILSRCEVVDVRGMQDTLEYVQHFPIAPQVFLNMSPQDRLEKIKSTTKDEGAWNTANLLGFVQMLEKKIHEDMQTSSDKDKYIDIFETLETVKGYLRSPSASMSMLLEMLALTL